VIGYKSRNHLEQI